MNFQIHRVWIYRLLVGIAGVVMALSAVLPWWKCVVEHSQYGYQATVTIYQYGILDAPMEVAGDITPPIQIFLGISYVAVSIVLMLWSTFLQKRKGQLVLGGVGLAYIFYALAAAYIVITPRMAEMGGTLQGYSEIMIPDYGEIVLITTALQRGYYLAYIAGILSIILSLTRDYISGRDLPGTRAKSSNI